MKKLDVLTPVGIIVGFIVVLFAIFINGDLAETLAFLHPSSFLIVVGGTAAALLVTFNLKELRLLPTVLKSAFSREENELADVIDTFVELSDRARREGLLALEAVVEEVEDPFLKKGVLLAVDGVEPEVIHDIMSAEVAAMEERHNKGRAILEKAGDFAPSWGMIGTLIGLVLMLRNLENPATLGPNMAIAIMTTLYGSLFANLVFLPMATKLANKTEKEVFMKQIIIEGVIGVQSGQNPKVLQEKLSAFLAKSEKEREDEDLLEEGR